MARSRARLVCRWGIGLFAVAYAAALTAYGIGESGLFGQPRDPLAGVCRFVRNRTR